MADRVEIEVYYTQPVSKVHVHYTLPYMSLAARCLSLSFSPLLVCQSRLPRPSQCPAKRCRCRSSRQRCPRRSSRRPRADFCLAARPPHVLQPRHSAAQPVVMGHGLCALPSSSTEGATSHRDALRAAGCRPPFRSFAVSWVRWSSRSRSTRPRRLPAGRMVVVYSRCTRQLRLRSMRVVAVSRQVRRGAVLPHACVSLRTRTATRINI